jgi:hypothetical protein
VTLNPDGAAVPNPLTSTDGAAGCWIFDGSTGAVSVGRCGLGLAFASVPPVDAPRSVLVSAGGSPHGSLATAADGGGAG